MGMRAPDGGNAAVQIIPHRELFARGVRVELDEGDVIPALVFLQDAVDTQERVVRAVFHIAAADQVDDEQAAALRAVKNAPALPRALRCEVGRTQDVAVLVEIRNDLLLAEGMIAERHHIRPGIKDVLCLPRQHAVPGGVLAVDDDKIRAGIALYPAQQRMQRVKAGLADDIADG